MYPQYPPQQPPQQYQQPGYPQTYPTATPPIPQYPTPPQSQYPTYPLPPQAPAPTVSGSIDDFFDQPTTGSKAWVFKDRPIGTQYVGIVTREVTRGDIRQQTDQQGRGLTFRDGRPKFVMVVPMTVAPTQEFPEGQASWWVKGQARDELVRAMAEAGAPAGPPEAGAAIGVTLVGMRPIPGFNPAFQYRITYRRPTGAPPVPVEAVHQAPAPVEPAYYPPAPPAQAAPPPQYAAPDPAPAPAPGAPPGMAPNQLTAEQQALLAQLTGS